MARSADTKSGKKPGLIDPVYQKFTKSVIRALGSNDFYAFFMDSIARADNEFQFSNRRMEKTVDITWVDAIEEALTEFQNIIALPRHVIHEEELIVNVANAKKGGADVVQHLAMHASMVEEFNQKSGEVRPSRLMQKYREESLGLYENRLVYTVLENAYQFVRIRHDALFSAMSDEFGAKLKVRSDMDSATEAVHLDMFLHIKDTDSTLETDDKNSEVFARISRLLRVLNVMMNSTFAQEMAKLPRVKGAVTKTNVIKRNPHYHKIMQLGEFLRNYTDVGYTIRVTEQNPQISEQFQQDIYHNILFNYLILKGYLEHEKERQVPAPTKERKRVLKPKFIKQIIEELTEDYDLPDVEIRKVLIEELTKEQLMHEEAEERRRLVEERQKRKKEEEERLRQEKKAEKERLRKEREAEKERIRLEKEAEEERLLAEQMARQAERHRRSSLFRKELTKFTEAMPGQLEARQKAALIEQAQMQDFVDAVQILEQTEQRQKEAAEREKQRRREAREEKQRQMALARQAELQRLEQERLAKLAQEEQLRREQEEAEKRRQQELLEQAIIAVQPYRMELEAFTMELDARLADRLRQQEQARYAQQQREQLRKSRQAAKGVGV
ncbi:MAG: hypothetical protein IJX37_05720 [Oscillospiraceae bacterium]|nr:hypothetical protein [Oscillospiraceae bacterium]